MSDQTIDRTKLPIRRPPFQGVVKRTLDGSQPDWNSIAPIHAPEGAPNVLLVLTDDAGFGNPSSFGGPISTPTLDRLGEDGLRYNRFHTTALCSPTRAALMTGRNHHAVGFGMVGEFAGPFPGYSANLPKDCMPFPKTLQGNGYSTGCFGKWHLTPDNMQGPSGPFDRWPNAVGFDYFWGFLGGESGQFDPVIIENNRAVGIPEDEDFYFPDAMADRTIEWIHGVRASGSEKPWFVYFAPGASHAPHQVPTEWSDKYKGKFDQGWDRLREETFARQKQLGVIPADAELTPRSEAMPAWDSLDETHKRLYSRQMEVYAGYCENADWNIGRVIDAIDEMGELDNTLVIYIWGDNGASMEGSLTGTFNELTTLNGIPLTDEQQLQLVLKWGGFEAWGTDMLAPHYSAAWAWAGDCPFQWGKQVASHLGGTRDPMIVHWPKRIAEKGRPSLAVHARDRRRPDHPRGRRPTATDAHRRRRAAADARDELPLLARRRERPRPAHAAVLRDPRQPRDVQGRLVARVDAAAHPVADRSRDAEALRARSLGSRERSGRALLPARRLHAGAGTSPTSTPRRWRSSRSSSGRRPNATACSHCSEDLRASSG